jgi:hypothetical protein
MELNAIGVKGAVLFHGLTTHYTKTLMREYRKMENDKRLNKKIGTKVTALEAKTVKVLAVGIEKTGDVGDKVVLSCQHPDRKEPVALSQIIYLRDKKLETSGLWYKTDEDGNINKESALAYLLRFMKIETIAELKSKELDTAKGERGFLTLKAY